MSLAVAQTLVRAVELYLIAGSVFALVFGVALVHRVDAAARESSWGFRLLIVPGVALLWPLFVWRLLRGKGVPVESNAHRDLASGAAPGATRSDS